MLQCLPKILLIPSASFNTELLLGKLSALSAENVLKFDTKYYTADVLVQVYNPEVEYEEVMALVFLVKEGKELAQMAKMIEEVNE